MDTDHHHLLLCDQTGQWFSLQGLFKDVWFKNTSFDFDYQEEEFSDAKK